MNTPINTNLTATPTPKRNPRSYTLTESIFAWFCFLAGYIFCRVFPIGQNPLGGFLFIASLFIGTTVIFKIQKKKLDTLPIIIAFSAILVSSALILCSNGFMRFLAYIYSLFTYFYFIYAVHGNTIKKIFSSFILLDYINALFAAFDSICEFFKAMFYGKIRKSGTALLKILGGIAIAVIPTFIVLSLLSYDNTFSDILENIFDFEDLNIFSHIFSLILAVPIGMYMFGAYVSCADKRLSNQISSDATKKALKNMRSLSALTLFVASLPILFLYVVFFISQWQYYISGFTGVLPEGFSYAEYAREGFFQLLAVSFINLVIILVIYLFMKRDTVLPKIILKILTIIYSVFTLILISTALSKMLMYIDWYGLTQKRVYTTCVMIVLAVFFVLMIVRQFVKKIPVVAITLILSFIMFIGLTLFNIDAMIASYNVNRYIDGSLETIDIEALEDLGYAGIPELVRLLDVISADEDPDAHEEITKILENMANEFRGEKRNIFSFSVPASKAEAALKEIGLLSFLSK